MDRSVCPHNELYSLCTKEQPMDVYSEKTRSQVMSRIRSCGTSPEKRLSKLARSVLTKRHPIMANCRAVAGCPDLFVPSLRLAIFLDGCFFHCCPIHGHIPKSNMTYWKPKLERNAARDRKSSRRLRAQGISVWRFWEHDLKPSRIKGAAWRLSRAVMQQKRKLGK